MPFSTILPRTSSPPAIFSAASLAFPLTRLAISFTTPPRAVSSPLRMSRLTSPPPVDPLRPPTPSGVSQVDPFPGTVPVEVAVDSGVARGAASRGAASGGAEPASAEPGGAEPEGAEPVGAESDGAESGDNKAMIALCQEHRLEHRTKHIALRYFLTRELQQRCQLRLAYVATRASTADIFTKALQSGDHHRFCTV
ncbi:unnamed protein product [Closterium sp. NIES-54]